MEIEKRQAEIAKKLWNIVRIVFYMMRRSNAKRKIMVELNTLLKKGRNAGKALGNLILHHHHYSALTCRPNDANAAFVSPREYEFSCSNTPLPKRKNHHHYQAEELKVMQKVFGILSRYDVATEAASPLPGPAPRQLRAAAPPSPAEEKGRLQVDKDAEEFINKFYRELKKQRPIETLVGSPSPYHEWAT